ncbi:MAG: adenylate/guanylate cyclase domain-containing protein, partial [Chloroflexota bacterium]|nr:adenylate/guanylate cyclase domain-containing protein [Chloroflexota bacterium]
PLEDLQRFASDRLFSREGASPSIVLVAIDDEALAEHGRLGDWDRSLHAAAIRNLHEAGATAIVYDVLFADPAPGDADLTAALSQVGNVVLPVVGGGPVAKADPLYAYDYILWPPLSLREASVSLAHVNLVLDSDGRVRRIPLMVSDVGGTKYPSLSLAALYLLLRQPLPASLESSGDHLKVLERSVPLENSMTMRVNWVGGQDSFATIPFEDVLNNSFDGDLVKHKVVLVGSTASGIDVHSVPLEGRMSGLEIHGNALDTLLRARFLEPVSASVTLVIVLLLAGVSAVLLPRWRLGWGLLLVLGLATVYVAAGAFLFGRGYIVNFVYPPAVLGLVFVVTLAYRTIAERTARRELRELFGRYVSPQVAEALVDQADREELQLGGELREVSILFADVREFTPISQRLTPTELVRVLNRHFDIIISHAMNNEGIVNHFAGDCVMAIWNAPSDQPEHALLACRTALGAQQELEALAHSSVDFPVVRFGFGINTGQAVAGNIGSAGRLDYTVIGSSVNVASRLCGAAPAGDAWIGERTYDLVKEQVEVEEMTPQTLKGLESPVTAYRLRAIAEKSGWDR